MNVTTQPILMTSVADGWLRQYDYPDNSEINVKLPILKFLSPLWGETPLSTLCSYV
jgi:hypothetical protein